MYMYQATLFCDSCGEAIRKQLDEENKSPKDIENEYSYDSDDYPKSCGTENENDSINHCDSNDKCLEAINLADYGLDKKAALVGMETRLIGCLLTSSLTSDGIEWLQNTIHEANCPNCSKDDTEYQKALYELWKNEFDCYLT